MEQKTIKAGTTDILFYDIYPVYFIVESEVQSMLIRSTTEEGKIDISMSQSFNYKRMHDKQWCIFIDVKFTVKGFFSTYIRSSFYLKCDLEKLFTTAIIEPIMQEALDRTAILIIEEYKKNDISFDNSIIPFNETIKNNWVKETIERFNKQALEKETADEEKEIDAGLTIPFDEVAKLILQGTMIIVDKVCFDDEVFDWKHNIKVLNQTITLTAYISLRAECFAIGKGPVPLNWRSTTYLLICIDMALQLLLGEHSEKLEKAIANKGMTKDASNAFISEGGRILTSLKQTLKRDGMHIQNLDKVYDWNELIK